MRVLIDTKIVLDFLLQREIFFQDIMKKTLVAPVQRG